MPFFVSKPTLAMLVGIALSSVVRAQAPTGTILGTVKDSSGALVSNARLTITNKATNISREMLADAQGFYSAPALQPGEYEVRVEAAGFRTTVRDAEVTAGNNTTVDINMTLGEAKQVVTVEAASAQVNYESNTVQGVIDRQTIQDLPLNGRSALQLASLEARSQHPAGKHVPIQRYRQHQRFWR